ncbi:MAG TPA: hypothetical protein VEH76_12850 [Methylocystis sp.]|nr:hypothetical protein [Methylocystis sp.]
MSLERILFYLTGAFVLACVGVAMLLVGPPEPESQVAAPPPAAVAAAPEQTPATAEQPIKNPEAAPPTPAPVAAAKAGPQQRLDAMVAAAPEYDLFFKRLRENFPAEHAATLDELNAPSGDRETIDQLVSEAVRNLRRARGVEAAHAEPAALAKVFEAQAAVLRAIAERDAKLCVAFLYGGADLGDFSRFAATRRSLVADMALAGLDAIVNGKAKQVERAKPTDDDFKTLEAALAARGLGPEMIGALLDGRMPDPPPEDQRMCAAGQTYLDTLKALPAEPRQRIYGLAIELMARS